MIDLHAHVLVGLDDGPKNEADAVALVRQAVQDGTDTIVAAAHANDHHFEVLADDYHRALARMRSILSREEIAVTLVSAMEVRLGPDLVEGFRRGRYLPMGDSRYFCVELPPNDFPAYAFDVLDQLTLEGLRLLIIHPERNREIRRHPELAERLMHREILGVASAGSLLGQFGPEVESAGMDLIERGFIQTVASDGHSVVKRPLRLSPVKELLCRRFGEDEAARMMQEIPRLVLSGQRVELVARQSMGWRRWLTARH